MLQEAKEHWASFGSDIAKDVLVSGDAAVGQIWNGFSAKAREEGANIEYAYPKQGYMSHGWTTWCCFKDAPNRDAALKFMNFLLDARECGRSHKFRAATPPGIKDVDAYLDPVLIAFAGTVNPPADAPAGTFVQVCDEATSSRSMTPSGLA